MTIRKTAGETKTKEKSFERSVGRRKTASARVRLMPGKGNITVNGKPLKEFFPMAILLQKIISPLLVVGKEKDFDISIKVAGGGKAGQAEAIRHGIARALVLWNEETQKILRASGFLTRDQRAKERKKFGRHKARRGHQWRKR